MKVGAQSEHAGTACPDCTHFQSHPRPGVLSENLCPTVAYGVVLGTMDRSEDEFEFPEVWDEYQWERFLQEQDRNTEKYFALLEKYMDHPDRDRVIAREMGWAAPSDGKEEEEMLEEFESFLEEAGEADASETEAGPGDIAGEEAFDRFTRSPIYKDTLKLHHWIRLWLDKYPDLQEHPQAVRLATQSAVCGAKVAAALCGEDDSELGMSIAYLKRGLKASNDALDACARLSAENLLSARRSASLSHRLFRVRNQIVDLMNTFRTEWQRRHGMS